MPVQGTYMVKVWNKLKQMKVAMKQLNNKDFSKVEQRILESRRHLLEIQEQLRECYHDQERRFQKLCFSSFNAITTVTLVPKVQSHFDQSHVV